MKKKLQLKKETIAVLNGESMNKIVGGAGAINCMVDADCAPEEVCMEGQCGLFGSRLLCISIDAGWDCGGSKTGCKTEPVGVCIICISKPC